MTNYPIETRVEVTTSTGRQFISRDHVDICARRYSADEGYQLRQVVGHHDPRGHGFVVIDGADLHERAVAPSAGGRRWCRWHLFAAGTAVALIGGAGWFLWVYGPLIVLVAVVAGAGWLLLKGCDAVLDWWHTPVDSGIYIQFDRHEGDST